MIKFINIIFIVALFASSAQALELGQVKLLSYLNEPLKADISLGRVSESDLADLHFSLADQDTYRSMGLDKPFYLDGLKFKLVVGKDRQHFVQVSTRQRIREPILDLFIKLEGMQGSLTRLYTLMLDPSRLAVSTQTPVVQHLPVAGSSVARQEKPVKTDVSFDPQRDESVTEAGNTLVANDSISIIAQNSSLHEKYSVYQIMRAFYLLNPQAFIKGNINHLQAGSRLLIPPEERVAEVPRQQAVNFVYARSKNQPDKKQPLPVPARPELARTDLDKVMDEASRQPVSTEPESAENDVASRAGSPVALKSDLKKDLKDWRNMADEFANLSFIMQTQNSVLKTHGDTLKQIDVRIEQEADQLHQLQQRIELLEKTAPPLLVNTVQVSPGSEADALAPAGESSHTRFMIEQINLRLQALEQQTSQQTPKVFPVEPVLSSEPVVPVAEIQSTKPLPETPVSAPALIDQGKSWMALALLTLAALVLLVVREINWRRKLKQLSIKPTAVEAVDDEALKPENDLVVDGQENEVPGQDDIKLEQTVESNLQVADKKFEEAIAQAREFKLDSAAAEKHHASQPDDDALYAEIDILIAYQLYDEALKMVQSAREKKPDNHCLDIRELEILAYINEEDLFLQKYEAYKEQLSIEFPEAWARIEALHNELETTYPRIVTL